MPISDKIDSTRNKPPPSPPTKKKKTELSPVRSGQNEFYRHRERWSRPNALHNWSDTIADWNVLIDHEGGSLYEAGFHMCWT